MATRAISGLSLQAPTFPSAIRHTGAAIIVEHMRLKKTTTSSAGYIFITWVCKMPQTSNLASAKVFVSYCHEMRKALVTSLLSPKMTNQITIRTLVVAKIYLVNSRYWLNTRPHNTHSYNPLQSNPHNLGYHVKVPEQCTS